MAGGYIVKRFFYVVGLITCGLVVIGLIGAGVMIYKAIKLSEEATAYVDAAIPAISAHWSATELLDRATPELKKNTTPVELTKLFHTLESLGTLSKYDGATGKADANYDSSKGTTITGSYVATGEYQNGTATFDVAIVKQDGHWMINGFHADLKLKPDAVVEKGT